MRDQTCTTVPGSRVVQIRASRALEFIKGWPPLRKKLVLALLLVLGGLSVMKLLNSGAFESEEGQEMIPVLLADQYIPSFTAIKPTMVTVRSLPRNAVAPGAIGSIHDLVNSADQALYVSAVALPSGHPLTKAVLSEVARNNTLATLLPNGKVAVSFSADRPHGAGGWVKPGDTVAVLATGRDSDSLRDGKTQTRMLFPALPVLAVDNERLGVTRTKDTQVVPDLMDAENQNGSSVLTVQMNYLEARILVEAQEKGHLSVMLRAPGDTSGEVSDGK